MLYHTLKRGMDIIGSLLGILLFLPFFPFFALWIVCDSKGSPLVALPRVSQGKIVAIYKFRTMESGARAKKSSLAHLNERLDGPFFKIKRDPRVTRAGRNIRRFRLDELPQLWNVLIGNLSLVGPRPHEPEEVNAYPQEYRHLPQAKAGLTGLSQVMGASALPFLKELEYDDYYLSQQSLALDLSILFKTVKIFFTDPTGI